MALIVKDRVKQSAAAPGTGTITLGSTPTGFQSFAAVGNANTTYFAIVDPISGDWEVNYGVYTSSGTTLTRNATPLSSSNSGSLVNFTGAVDVFVTYPSEKAVYEDTAGVVTFTDNPIFSAGTANGVTYLNGSKVLTSGSALTFDGTTFGVNVAASIGSSTAKTKFYSDSTYNGIFNGASLSSNEAIYMGGGSQFFYAGGVETFRTTSTSLYTASGINVGIGTSSTTNARLNVSGAVRRHYVTGGNPQAEEGFTYSDTSTAYAGMWFNNYFASTLKTDILFKTSNDAGTVATVATLNGAGNLGLGVTPSAWSVGKAMEFGNVGNAFWGVSATQISITQNAYYDGSWKYAANGYATRFQEDSGAYIWNTSPNNTSGAGAGPIAFTASMTLNTSGQLIVGDTSASGIITTYANVNSSAGAIYTRNINASSGSYSGLIIGNNISSNYAGFLLTSSGQASSGFFAPNSVYAYAGVGQIAIVTETANPIIFGTNGVPRVQIGTTGNVGIGIDGDTIRLAMAGTIADSTYPLIKGTVRAPYVGGWNTLAPETTIGGYQLFTYRSDNGEINKSSALEVYLVNNTFGAGITGMRFITGGYNSTNGSEAMRINEFQNVGIGTNNPQNRLQVVNTTRPQFSVSYQGSTGLYLEDSTNNSYKSWKLATSTVTGSALEFYKSTTTSGVPTWEATPSMSLDTSGNLLVGTTTAQGKVESKTSAVLPATSAYAQKAFVANIPYSTLNITSSLLAAYDSTIHGVDVGYAYDGAGYYLAFATNSTITGSPTERVKITSNGLFVISGTGTEVLAINKSGGNSAYLQPVSSSDASLQIKDSSGSVNLTVGTSGKSLALQGGTVVTGTGITFPATASLSSNANTLDDYEEGTWTPELIGSGTTGTPVAGSGYYTKVGNLVTIFYSFEGVASPSGATGILFIRNMPFQVASSVYNYGNPGLIYTNGGTSLPNMWYGHRINDATGLQFYYTYYANVNTSPSNFDVTNLASTGNYLRGYFSYQF